MMHIFRMKAYSLELQRYPSSYNNRSKTKTTHGARTKTVFKIKEALGPNRENPYQKAYRERKKQKIYERREVVASLYAILCQNNDEYDVSSIQKDIGEAFSNFSLSLSSSNQSSNRIESPQDAETNIDITPISEPSTVPSTVPSSKHDRKESSDEFYCNYILDLDPRLHRTSAADVFTKIWLSRVNVLPSHD